MRSTRRVVALISCLLLFAGCSDDTGDGASAPSTTTAIVPTTEVGGVDGPSTSTPTVPIGEASELNGIVLARALVQVADLPGYEVRTPLRAFSAEDRKGLLVCGEDLRAATGLIEGVQAVFVRGNVQITVTVTSAADEEAPSSFVERFGVAMDGCAGPWTQQAANLGDAPLDAEILEAVDVGDPGVPTRAVRLRTTSDAGSSDVIVAVLAIGPIMSAVTVAGPVDADLGDAAAAVEAAARRAGDLAGQLG